MLKSRYLLRNMWWPLPIKYRTKRIIPYISWVLSAAQRCSKSNPNYSEVLRVQPREENKVSNSAWPIHRQHSQSLPCRCFKMRILTEFTEPWALQTPNVPSNFLSHCAHKISCVQHLTSTHLYLEWHVWTCAENIFQRKMCMRSKFSCVRSSHNLCAHAYSLEGTLQATHAALFKLR